MVDAGLDGDLGVWSIWWCLLGLGLVVGFVLVGFVFGWFGGLVSGRFGGKQPQVCFGLEGLFEGINKRRSEHVGVPFLRVPVLGSVFGKPEGNLCHSGAPNPILASTDKLVQSRLPSEVNVDGQKPTWRTSW